MPAVAVCGSPSGLPIATARSPTLTSSESANCSGRMPSTSAASTRMTARSVLVSLADDAAADRAAVVAELHADGVGLADDVGVGDDRAVGVDEEAGAAAAAGLDRRDRGAGGGVDLADRRRVLRAAGARRPRAAGRPRPARRRRRRSAGRRWRTPPRRRRGRRRRRRRRHAATRARRAGGPSSDGGGRLGLGRRRGRPWVSAELGVGGAAAAAPRGRPGRSTGGRRRGRGSGAVGSGASGMDRKVGPG